MRGPLAGGVVIEEGDPTTEHTDHTEKESIGWEDGFRSHRWLQAFTDAFTSVWSVLLSVIILFSCANFYAAIFSKSLASVSRAMMRTAVILCPLSVNA